MMYANMFNVATQTFTFFINGRPETINVEDPRYNLVSEVMDKYHCGEYSDDSAENSRLACEALDKVLSKSVTDLILEACDDIVESVDFDDLRLVVGKNGLEGTYRGVSLPAVLTQKFYDMYVDGCTNFAAYFKFIDNILKNPRNSVRNELYDFLAAESLPINEDGNFIAYKGVRSDMYSVTGSNTDKKGNFTTTVLEGQVDQSGHILNSVGSTIRVRVTDVCDDRTVGCAQGLHVGSYSYASGFGQVTLAVEVNPMNVISVPTDCSCQKCRVSEYTVKCVIDRRIETPTVQTSDDGSVTETDNTKRSGYPGGGTKMSTVNNADTIVEDIINQIRRNGGYTTIRQLRGSVGRKHSLTSSDIISFIECHDDRFELSYAESMGATEVTENDC